MDRRCAAGALLALAACIASSAAAPTASNQTALDLYDGASEGCYYNFQHYGEGDRIMTNEPCLNCTCHNRMLMCYLRVCPFTKPIGQDCSVEKRADQCCPIVTCPDVPVDLLTSTSTSSPAEYGETGLGKLDRYGCSINGKYFPEGSKVPPSPNKPCEHCYCIRNMTTCVMQECTLHVDGCTPIYRKDVCCPVRYSCDHPEDEIPLLDDMTTTVRPTPGFLLTTTTLSPVTQMTQDCVHDEKVFADGALIKTEKACEHCYCMKGDIVCVVQECGTPMENEGKNCTSIPPREGQCCPDTYICEGDELTTESKPDIATVTSVEDITTLSPPRRVSIEGSGYRSETDEPFTEVPTFEPDTEGSGEEQPPFKPSDASDMLIPESETSPPFITTEHDENIDQYSPSTTKAPLTIEEMIETVTTEPDKGENTVPSGGVEDGSGASDQDETTPVTKTTTTILLATTESSVNTESVLPEDESDIKDKITPHEGITVTEPTSNVETTIAEHEYHTSPENRVTVEDELPDTTSPTRRKENDELPPTETTTLKDLEELTTKSSDLIAPDNRVTDTATSPIVEQEAETTIPTLPEKDNEVLVKEPTTDLNLDLTTKSDLIETVTQAATTVQSEIATEFSTPSKIESIETTPANPIENEIDEESFPTLAPGRIPGEGDCLLDGVTYSHESIVPSSNNCHASCKCISSIVKCDPIVCSPPPDYMDNCQPMYDSPESCCPTYVCDHPRETVPPQSHSQMAGTESPMPTPTIECDGDQCEIVKDKDGAKPAVSCTSEDCTVDSSKVPEECGPQGCGEVETKPEEHQPLGPTQDCVGDSCSSSPEHCANGKCETAIPKDQTCNNENGCEIPVVQTCQGDDCAIHPDLSESTSCDNPDGCKDAKIPEKSPICEGESCISELPPKTIPQETQDCKDGEDCARPNQSPVIEECHEEGCKKQQVPDINKPAPSDCTDTECIQKDHIPQITEAPELNTESIPKLTELSEALETKSEGPVTDLPKTTAIEKEIELNIPTEASISEKEELSGTTPQYDDMIIQKEKEPQPLVPESPEIVTTTPEIQPQEIITENNIDQITTTAPLQDITKKEEISPEVSSAPSEVPTTEIPLLSDKDIKEFTTELPGFADTELPESVTKPIDDTLLDDKHAEVTNPPGDVVNDKEVLDITTVEPSLPVVHDSSPDIIHETTESQEMLTLAPESMDRQGQEEATKEPEYVQDTEPKVTEPAEAYTTAPERMSTDKLKEEPLQEQEKQDDAPTTPKSYDSQTNVPETLGTKAPVEEVSDSDTIVPELQTTSPQLVNQETELPVSILSPEEPITVKPDDVFQTTEDVSLTNTKEDAETKTPVFDASPEPHMPLDESGITQAPELSGTSDVETSTRVPVQDITDEPESHTESSKTEVTLPQETVTQESDVIETEDKFEEIPAPVTVNVPTNTPMSIVKDHDDDEISITRSPESKISTERDDEVITKKPESPEFELPLSTESYGPKPEESLTEKPVSDIEQLPSVTNEQSAATTEQSESDLKTTISLIVEDEVATKQPHVSEITGTPETEISTDNTPVSVSIVEEPASSEYFEPSVTEAGIQVSSVSQEKTSESSPTTIMTSEDIETKSPDTATESSNKPEGDDSNYLTQDENMATTELPELIVHEHPTEPSPIGKEPEQPVSEEIATKTPDSAITELQEIEPEKDTTDAPMPHDAVTKVSETPTSELQNEMTEIPDHEFITETSESTQPETTDSKADDAMSHVPEIPATESQQEVTEAPETQGSATNIPVTTATDTQSEATEAPVSQEVVTSVPITSEIEPQETITEKIKSQDAVTNTPDMFATEPNKDSTEGPDSQESVTTPTDTFAEPHKESTDGPETLDKEPHKDIPEIQDTVTSIPEIFATESDKVITESPEPQDTSANVTEISPAESDKKATEEPETQDVVTSVPKTSVTEPQSETTKAPESQETVTNIPEIPETEPKKDTTETPAEDVATGIPEIPVTESVHVEETHVPEIQDIITTVPEVSVTEAEKDATEAPAHEDTFTNIPNVNAIEPQTESSKAPVRHDTTEVPDKFVTESQIDITQTLEPQNTATSAPELSKTESKKETTEIPESQEAGSTVPEISETEPKKEITEAPDSIIRAPETSATELHKEPTISPDMQEVDSNTPEITTPEYQKEATTAPEVQDIETKAPELLPKESQKATTETQETTEKIATEPHKALTELPESLNIVTDIPEATATESQKEVTVSSLAPEIATKAPEILDTESDKEITEAPEPDLITKTPERTQTEGETEQKEPDVTEKDETITEPPLKITTKLDDETQTEQQELITPTESSKIELETSQPTEERLPVDQSSKVPEALATESPDRITESVTETDNPTVDVAVNEEKPQEGQKIATEMPSTVEPTKTSEFSEPEISEVGTELPISPESVEIETKVPELSDTESGVTMAPELYVTEKQDYTHAPESETQGPIRTEATNSQVEEDIVTKAPEASEPQDKTRKPSEEPEQTSQSKDEYPETTPYLVILEEHTHKKDIYTTSLDEEITTTPSEIPQKEYESSTPQAAFAIPTESVQSTESEKLPLEDAMSDKDQSVTELIQTTEPAKITEPSVVSEELTTISPSSESQDTEKPQYVDTNEISTSAPTRDEEPSETEKPSVASIETETEKEVLATEKPHETTAPEEEFILATTKATTLKTEEELTTPSPLLDKFGKPDETPSPAAEPEKPKPDTTEEIPKPGANEIQPTEEAMQPEDESHFPPSGTSGYGQEPDYGEEDSFGPGTCRYGGKVYVSAQQIPRDDPCDFCFCFRSDIICLQQSCPPPIHGCHEEPIQGFCCPRYECPVSMATTLNVTTTTTTTTTTLPPHFLPHAYKGAAQRRGCQIKGHTYKVGEVVRASSGPCLHCTCGGDGQMKCDPKVCTPEPMLRQMIAAAVSAKRRR